MIAGAEWIRYRTTVKDLINFCKTVHEQGLFTEIYLRFYKNSVYEISLFFYNDTKKWDIAIKIEKVWS